MKKRVGILAAMALFAAAFISCASPSATGKRIELRAVARLSDGSELKGMAQEQTLDAESGNVGAFKLDLAKVAEIRPGIQAPATIVFADGDTLHATLSPRHEKFTLESLLGRIDIHFADIRTLTFSKRVLGDEEGLLYYCTFDDAASIASPEAGPSGKYLGGDFVEGKVGKALRSYGDAPVAEIVLPQGFLGPRGTIEFWARIEGVNRETRYVDGGNPRFFNLWLTEDGLATGPCSTHLQFTANDGMGMSGLCGMIYHRAMSTDPTMRTNTYAPLLDDPSVWHHYAIVWDFEGLQDVKTENGEVVAATIVLDGKVLQTYGRNGIAHGKGLSKLPELKGRLAFPTPADAKFGFASRRTSFLIDEFKIWSTPKIEP